MSINSLVEKKAIIFPEEIDTNGVIKYDFTKLNNTLLTNIFTSLSVNFNDIDCLVSFNTPQNSGLVSVIANLFNKEVLIIDPQTGFPAFGGRKINYKHRYAIWLDILNYNTTIFQGLEKLAKRGLRINSVNSLIDCHESSRLYISEVFPDVDINVNYELYDLMAVYESRNILTSFLVEKCKFTADKNRKLTHAYVETFIKNRDNSFTYMKEPMKWYVENYYEFNNLIESGNSTHHFEPLILKYITKIEWEQMRKELILYGNHISKLIINPSCINGLDLNELSEIQNKYHFNIIEYNPYFKLLDTRNLSMTDEHFNKVVTDYYHTNFDGIVYSINLSLLNNDDFKNDLTLAISLMSKKVLLYVSIDNESNIKLLQSLITYSNEYMNSRIQGVIFDYDQVSHITFDKKLQLQNLVPLILNVNELDTKYATYYKNNEYSGLAIPLHSIPLEKRNFTWLNEYEVINKIKNISEYLKELDDTMLDRLMKYFENHSFSLTSVVSQNKKTNSSSNDTHGGLIGFISPIAWYNYFMGNNQ